MFEIYFPECLLSSVSISASKIIFAIFFCNSPPILFPTFIIFILAKYSEIPLEEKATIINIGISQAKVLSWSIKIFFTAGSKSQAVAAVLPATIKERKRARIILLKCFFIYSLYRRLSIVTISFNFIILIY